ncbi:MAG: hypothetical protein JW942_01325 [Opitutales bacterium]|nr:hypothetical protein [Opitutales bacterium]
MSSDTPVKRSGILRHLCALLGELWSFARTHKVWWILPVVIILLLMAALLVSVSSVSPFIYTLF